MNLNDFLKTYVPFTDTELQDILAHFSKEEVYKNYTTAQMITVGLPIVILAIFGFLFTFLRKRKYSR